MADRIARPQARLMAEIAVARTVLNWNPGRVAYFTGADRNEACFNCHRKELRRGWSC